jgi:hypothetical protein
VGAKDLYNRTSPTQDADLFADYAEEPEVAELFNVVFGTSLREDGRTDISSLYIPDVLRVDTSTGPVPVAGDASFSRFSGIGGDVTAGGKPSGFPNGRRLGDDVVDIALTTLADGTLLGDNIAANDQIYNRVFPYAATPHSASNNTLIGDANNLLLTNANELANPVPEPGSWPWALIALMINVAVQSQRVRNVRSIAKPSTWSGGSHEESIF